MAKRLDELLQVLQKCGFDYTLTRLDRKWELNIWVTRHPFSCSPREIYLVAPTRSLLEQCPEGMYMVYQFGCFEVERDVERALEARRAFLGAE